jgi:ABC-type branched-subunit amino acid transport system substrate-binding protein
VAARSRRRWHWLGIGVAAALSIGCSSTTQVGTGPIDAARAEGAAPQLEGGSTPVPDAGGPVASEPGAAVAGGPRAAAAEGPGPAAGGAKGSGVMRIGIEYPGSQSGLAAAFGVNILTGGADWKTFIQPVIDDINAQGGIAGMQVEGVFHTTDTSRGSFAAQGQAVCSHFTEDDHVFAAIGFVLDPSEIACFRSHGTPFIGQAVAMADAQLYQANRGWYYQPSQISNERLVPILVDQLQQLGYFNGAKLGVLRMEDPTAQRFENLLRRELAARGIGVTADAVLSNPPSAADAGSLFTQAANAILRFRDAGVTHVLPVPSGSAIPFVFMNQAETQGYRPQWALTSLDVPAFMAPNAPKAQLHGAVGIGWMNGSDIHWTEVPKGINANEDTCWRLTKRNGDEAKRYCDGLFFLRDALARAPEVSPGGLLAGVEALGTSYSSPWAGPTRFGPGRYDGAAAVRPLRFMDECGCFRYTGPPVSAG